MDKLKRIVILVPKGNLIVSAMAGSYKLFKAAIELSGQSIELLLAGEKHDQGYLDDLFFVSPNIHWKEIDYADLIIVPAIKDGLPAAIEANQSLLIWLQKQYQKGAVIGSLCTGVFLLAAAGLVKHKRCTTHWSFGQQFSSMFPESLFQKNNIITEHDRIYTSGGSYSFLNLIVHLIAIYFGREIAIHISKIFLIDYSRTSQEEFVIFNTQKAHQNNAVIKAQAFIEANYFEKLTIEKIADVAKTGNRTLIRQFKKHTGNTPIEYLQRVRIEAAKSLLTNSRDTIGNIQYEIGYNDPKSFRQIFRRYTGYTPMGYRKKFSLIHESDLTSNSSSIL